MSTWNADQYLRFADERTRPCRDLAASVSVKPVRRVIDLGCGPGNSTAVLAERWPAAELTGLDSSAEMIDAARQSSGGPRWVVGDIGAWAEGDDGPYDVVFSNAALQWLPDHAVVLGRMFMVAYRPA
jgi:trans-aconitate 2-methyltransferase